MKNCELFKTEEELQKKWELRRKLAPNTPKGLTFAQWACYDDADLALQDQFLEPGLFIRGGEYVLVTGPRPDNFVRSSLVYVNYTDRYGTHNWDHAENLKLCAMPAGVLGLAKALVLEEIRAKCPLLTEMLGNGGGKDKKDAEGDKAADGDGDADGVA